MSDATRNLLISLCSHMAYMQGQLEALHQLDDPDDHYWFRESVALRQKVADHLAALADEPAEPEGKNPTRDELWELWLRLNNELPDRPAAVAEFWEHAQINARARAALADQQQKSPTKHELFKLLLQSGGATRCVSIEWIEPFANAVLARWGNHPGSPDSSPQPVAELVAKLRRLAPQNPLGTADPTITRAADLLERLSPPQPVPVSKRLPGPEDMTDDGEVWIEDPGHEYPLADAGDYDWEPHKWILRPIGKFDAQNGLRWLPAHALPLPEVGE